MGVMGYMSLLTYSFILMAYGNNDMGPGIYKIISVQNQIDEDENYDLEMDCVKRKLNRTHDAYNGTFELKKEVGYEMAVKIEVNKCVDGGCKPFAMITHPSLPEFVDKHAKKNFENFLMNANIHPLGFPIKAGKYEAKNYVIDPCRFPPECVYGKYEVKACTIKDSKPNACVNVVLECTRKDDDTCGSGGEE